MNSISIDDIEIPTVEGIIDNFLMSLLRFLRPLYYLLNFLIHVVNHSWFDKSSVRSIFNWYIFLIKLLDSLGLIFLKTLCNIFDQVELV